MINDSKDLEKFFKICRKQGVSEISFAGISVKFGDLPISSKNANQEEQEVQTEELTPEQLMYYAVDNAGAI